MLLSDKLNGPHHEKTYLTGLLPGGTLTFQTPDGDFHCFYPCEIILSLTYPYQPAGKIKNEQPHVGPYTSCNSFHDIIVMLKLRYYVTF